MANFAEYEARWIPNLQSFAVVSEHKNRCCKRFRNFEQCRSLDFECALLKRRRVQGSLTWAGKPGWVVIIKVIDLPASFIGNYELTHNDIPLLSRELSRSCWASRVSPIKRPGDAWQTGYWIGEIWSSMSLYKMCGRKRKAYFQTHLVCGEWAMNKHKLCTVYIFHL